jgi:hypothetical protein
MTQNPALEKLHGFYQPTPPAWTPQTIGWYALFSILVMSLLWVAARMIRSWLGNRYRRQALKELVAASPNQFSALLKRTALAAWPREKIASLSGDAWLKFLNEVAPSDIFQRAPGNRIEEIAFHQGVVSIEDEKALRLLTAEWIRRHRVQA